jgi:hypothetical protein
MYPSLPIIPVNGLHVRSRNPRVRSKPGQTPIGPRGVGFNLTEYGRNNTGVLMFGGPKDEVTEQVFGSQGLCKGGMR